MAILPGLEDLEVTICIDGRTATEYATPNDPYKPESIYEDPAVAIHQEEVTVTRYIKSKNNGHFTIEINVGPEFELDCPAISFQACIDERHWVDMTFMETNDLLPDKNWSCSFDGATVKSEQGRGRGFVKRKFKFTEITTS